MMATGRRKGDREDENRFTTSSKTPRAMGERLLVGLNHCHEAKNDVIQGALKAR